MTREEIEKAAMMKLEHRKKQVIVLFTMENSIYESLGCDCWGEKRDARNYAGNEPAITHPPCQRLGKMTIVNFNRWGG